MRAPEIRRRLTESRRSQADLGRALGKSKDSVSRLVNGERRIDADEAEAIRKFFDEDRPPEPVFQLVPVYGYAVPGHADRVQLEPEQTLDRIELPAGLSRAQVIAVRVPGDAMDPRLFAGETVIVGLGVPPLRGGDCLVELGDGTGMVKRYEGQRSGYLFLRHYNPDEEVRLPLTQVRNVHAVLYRR